MKRIGVISDTHLSGPNLTLAKKLNQIFTDVDIILHAGDLINLSVLNMFNVPKKIAVCGNMDESEVTEKLPNKLILEIDKVNFGLIHGTGSPFGIINRIKSQFSNVNCIVFGHSHQPINTIIDNILFFNPGSVCNGLITSKTVGLLILEEEKIKGEIIKL